MAFYNQEYDHSAFSYYLGGDPRFAFNIFARGYRGAAERLTRSLLRRRAFAGFEAYPAIFLYCHAFELSLKHAIYKAIEFAGYTGSSEIEDRLYKTHDLDKLAAILARSVELLFAEDSYMKNLMQRIRTTSSDLTAIDLISFRYPVKEKRETGNKPDINLRTFAQHMSSLLEDLDTLNFGLDAQTYIAQEAFTECVLGGLA